MKKILFVLFALLTICASDAFASKAVTHTFKVTLKDGRNVVVSQRGDENFSYYVSGNGELIIHEGNLWRVATKQEIQATETTLKNVMSRRTGEAITGNRTFPHIGNPRALVILANFSDNEFTFSVDQIEELFNGTEYTTKSGACSYSSLAQFMYDCSEGQYRPEFDVVGPYKLDKTVEYYGQDSYSSKDINLGDFVRDACKAADADVDFSQYDADGDGYVDLVYIVYAGYGQNFNCHACNDNTLWPKSGYGSYGTYDGVSVYRYGINSELLGYPDHYYTDSSGDQVLDYGVTDSDGNPYLVGIGVLAHEFCHTLGLPDVYPTASWSDVTMYDNQSMEFWDLMDGGENNYNGYYPTPLTAFERELFGWMEIDTLTEAANIEMLPLQDGGKAYRIMNDNDASGNEYYILEAIPSGKGTGWYRRMRGNGLLVTHINYDVNMFSNFNCPNNVAGSPRWTILPADSIIMTSYRMQVADASPNYIDSDTYYADMAGDTYPGTSNVTEITDYQAYTGTIDKPITEISQDGFNISFKFMGGVSGIKTIDENDSESEGLIYNLQGQRVGADYRGIVIKGGKKYLNK